MLNRRILRVKLFKVLYSYAEDPTMTLKEAQAQLNASCEATRELYLYMLAVIVPLTSLAADITEELRSKNNPTAQERNPNMKFINNALAKIFAEDIDFNKILAKKKFSWENNDAFLHNLYKTIIGRDYYKAYMNSEGHSLKEDAALWMKIFEEEFSGNAECEAILEEYSMHWVDDLEYALTYCCKTVKALGKGEGWALPVLYQSDNSEKAESDKDFIDKVLTKAYFKFQDYYDMMASSVNGWDKDRLFITDVVLVSCGLAEAECFPELSVKVTINEYVEISKFFGTPSSRSFVNGILNNLIHKLMDEGVIVKRGAGLL